MFFRFILTALIVYVVYRFFKSLTKKESPKEEVRGRNRNQPLDLRDSDVDDARFEDIDDRK